MLPPSACVAFVDKMKRPLDDFLFRLRGTENDLISSFRRRREVLQHAARFPRPSPWSQRALAEHLGVTKMTISQWEGGYCYPTTWALFEAWAEYLGMKIVVDLRTVVSVETIATWRRDSGRV